MPKKKKSERKKDNEKKGSTMKEQIKNCKEFLDLDLSSISAGGLLPYKLVIDSLTQALELKNQNDESSMNKMRELFLSINKANLDIKISNIKKKIEKPLQQDLDAAEEFFNAKHKEYEERKFYIIN